MFAIASLESMGILLMVCSEPVNSMAWFNTSSLLNSPQRATITSFPVTPGGRMPVRVTLAMLGISVHTGVSQCAEGNVLGGD
jgi:hypothetical protein